MKKILLAGVAVLALGMAAPAMAQSNGAAVGGATAGGATGGTIGFLLGGPVGAIIGGFAGAVIGSEAAVSAESVAYAGNNPVDPIYIDGGIEVGAVVTDGVTVYPIQGDPDFGYFYANGRVYIVDLATNEIVQSPGYAVSERAISYVEANPSASVTISGNIGPGYVLENNVEFAPVPDDPAYGYVYIDGRPALVDRASRTIIWVR
ncbi:Protein of unknown function [Devosia enhydra]|uniref:DUF1236 domain-containing protein n=1 Tax=Devosia enhydra TaxID=665118 RepID=A0A1K2HX60_9HYPH|nr:DUF1236 domain-containing protein [Devosia enhydra]SFZ84188.1 Protein of unknown function [Devosia enhydra]